MNILKIQNFLCIDHAEIEIKAINLLIGEQAQGKSVIAKLIYFFQDCAGNMVNTIRNNENEFEKIFPKYTWGKTEFDIVFTSHKNFSMSVANKLISNEFKCEFKFNPHKKELKDSFERHLNSAKNDTNLQSEIQDDAKLMENTLIYIPAGRSFYANLKNNIFAFMVLEIQLDYFIQKFGIKYEYLKNSLLISVDDRKSNLVENIIGGTFKSENGRDWIINNKKKIAVEHSSSGQQEALPLVIILTNHEKFKGVFDEKYFIIEEPEAHLFPTAQGQIVSLISSVYNEVPKPYNHSFIITTHSPYILTAFNNLIQAGNVAASKNYQNLEELYKVVPKDEIVDFNDVSAYLVNNGTVQSILDNDLKLIDATMIDSVSRQFSNTFEQLVIMENECD